MQRCCIVNKYWSEVKVWKRCQNGTTGWNPDWKSYQNVINKESGSAVHVCGLVFYLQCWRVMRICHRSYCFARHSVYIVPLCYMIWHSSEFDRPWVYLPFKTSVRVCSVCVIAIDHSCCQRAWTRSKTSLGLPSVETHSSNTFHSLPTFQKIKSVFSVGKIV